MQNPSIPQIHTSVVVDINRKYNPAIINILARPVKTG
jgi:hypothetical protein